MILSTAYIYAQWLFARAMMTIKSGRQLVAEIFSVSFQNISKTSFSKTSSSWGVLPKPFQATIDATNACKSLLQM
jgi:hypothetical protein